MKTATPVQGRGQDLEQLSRMLRAGRGVLMVAGHEVGRSAVLRQLADSLGERVHRVGPGMTIADLLPGMQVRAENVASPSSLAGALRRGLLEGAVLLADDFERLDSLTQRTLEQLCLLTPPPGSGWLVSVTHTHAARFRRCARYELPPLSPREMAAFIRVELRSEPGRALEEWLMAQGQGCPRRMRIAALGLRFSGFLDARGGLAGTPDPDMKIPLGTILEGLDEDARTLLQLACLADEPFDFAVLERASGLSSERAESAGRLLREGGLLEEGRVGPTELRNPNLPIQTKRRLHAALADALEALGGSPAARGRQLAAAGRSSDAAWLLMEGGRQARQQGLLVEALQLFDTAAGCLLLGDPVVGVARAETLLEMGRPEEAERALAKLDDSADVRRAILDVKIAREQWDEAHRLCQRALSAAPGDPQLELRMARISAHQGDRAGAIGSLERALPGVGPEVRLTLGELLLAAGDVLRLREVLEPLLEHPELRFRALLLLGKAQHLGGRGTAGRGRLEEACSLAAQQKLPEREAEARLLQASLLDAEGDFAQAAQSCERAVALLRPGGESIPLAQALELLGKLRLEQKQPAEAEKLWLESVVACDVAGDRGDRARARLSLGRFQLKQKRYQEAAATLREAEQLAQGGEQLTAILTELAVALRLLGSFEAAMEAAEAAVEEARQNASSELLGNSLLALGEMQLERKLYSETLETLQEAHIVIPPEERMRLLELFARLHEEGARQNVPLLSQAEAQRFRAQARELRGPSRRAAARIRIPAGAVAAVAVLLLVVGAFFLWPRQGTLEIVAEPPDAEVYIDGNLFQAPLSLKLSTGPHEVKVAKQGYKTYQETIELGSGGTYKLVPHLESASGGISIVSTPKGARVYLEGQARGLTPLELKGLPPQRFSVKVTKQGFKDYVGGVDVVAGKTRNLSIELRKR